MTWTLTWGDITFGPDDLTVGDVALVDGITGCGWRAFDGLPSPRVAAELLSVVVARKTGRPLNEVAAEVIAAPAEMAVPGVGP